MNAFLSNKKITGVIALLLAALLLLPAAGCGRAPEEEEDTTLPVETTAPAIPEGSITAPYTALDSLNPFFTETLLNFSLISLVYDSLYYLDGGFTPVPCIAQEATAADLTLRVALVDALVFSDATPVSAADVVYSFTKAKEAPLYKQSLGNVLTCEADSTRSVVFTLDSPDVNAVNVLTFPIVKTGTAETEDMRPIGSGCYKYKRDSLRIYMEYNLKHVGGIPEIGTVRLREVNESDTLMHQLNTGSVDCFFTDMADGIAKHSYAGVNDIYLNNFVFLGINHTSAMLYHADLRRAVSLAISRVSLVENAFMSHARAAVFPFNPSWDALSGLPEPNYAKYESDPNAADALLATLQAGTGGGPLYYNLIVQESNNFLRQAAEQIAEQLAMVNLNVTVNTLSEKDYKAALREGAYDFYLSEIKLTKNMDLSPFFSYDGAASWGMKPSELEASDIYSRYRSGETELSAFLEAFDTEMPFIPLVYRNGQFCYSRNIKSGVAATEDRLFMNVAEWKLG